ncbi:MAG: cytochrome c oxidase accessory protein CcoG [Saprospiraceae bacterium]|nr:cytochrome c oxidase accessory protein CcoG [Saprospiraceae bacterium]MBK7738679.1 cytochrome c oxidase accessory protein CcoG [Saprospiraceae bacterium]MBK7912749.1 cytochrome c oxidase accessory protein CcoG [Saprospiraceae bacterium]
MNLDDLQEGSGFRDRISSVDEEGSRKWIFASKVSGRFYNYRNYSSFVYLILFFAIPFIWVHNQPLVLFNILEGKFILFSKIFWPNDFFIFAVAMITFIIFIALFTVIYGRLFCGWACPQTIFMEMVFRKIEWLIEGSPGQQKLLQSKSWTSEWWIKKSLKHFIFLAFSFLIANTFLAYIIGIDQLYKIILKPISENIGLLSGLIVFTLLFYGVFAFVRDIICTTVCPYGRLQSVLFDKDTMQISYDYTRGEPRERLHKNQQRTQGDCVDCMKCVQVCPTGIDIRNGVQMECVGCTACIDACDEVMDKVGFKRGLIRYASENEISRKTSFKFNNRMKAYTALLSILILAMVVLIATRNTIDAYVQRVPGQLYQEVNDSLITNLYTVKFINKSRDTQTMDIKLANYNGNIQLIGNHEIKINPESVSEYEFFIGLSKDQVLKRSNEIKLNILQGSDLIHTLKTNFLGPFK